MDRPLILDLLFDDDRQFVLDISQGTSSSLTSAEEPRRRWFVVTRRNVAGRTPTRTDEFTTRLDALEFYKRVVVETPLASLGGKARYPLPSVAEYTVWLKENELFDPVLNPYRNKKTDI
jgi:hypothetical protein